MKTRAILPLLVLTLLPLLSMAQNWMPVKMNQKVWYLHKHAISNRNIKPVGITDTVAYGLLRLMVNHHSVTGQYRSMNSFGVMTPNNYFFRNPTRYNDPSYRGNANFWFRELDSVGVETWHLNTLDDHSLVFCTAWPAGSRGTTVRVNGTNLSIYYAQRKIDTLINGIADSALIFALATNVGSTQMILSKNNGLLKWRDVQLWTSELRPRTNRKFNYDFMATWAPGTKRQFLTTSPPRMFSYGDSTLISTYVNSNVRTGNTRIINKTDTVYLKEQTGNNTFTLSVRVSTKTDSVSVLPEYPTIHVPDTMAPYLSSTTSYSPLYRTLLPMDTTKPWFVVEMGAPVHYWNPVDTNLYYLRLDEFMPESFWVEGLEESLTYFFTANVMSPFTRRLLYLETGTQTIGTSFRFSTVTNLAHTANLGLKLYPNPAQEYIRLDNDSALPIQYFILDAMGRQVGSGVYEGGSISVKSLPSGVYLLHAAGASYTFIKN